MDIMISDSIFGILILAYGIIAIINKRKFIINSEVIQGTVKDVIYDGLYYYPILEYADKDNPNIKYTYELKNCSRNFYHEVGKSVEVLYYKDGTNTKMLINSWLQYWGFTIMLVVVGIIIIALI
jgi:hypothetical protein